MKKLHRCNYILIICIAIICCLCVAIPVVKPIIAHNKVQYIIDAGHGLPDGGAVGIDGTTEQQLNLSISNYLHSLFQNGESIMTRKDEYSIATHGFSIREKKISDMKARVAIANEYPDALFISVHMNTYPNSSVYGCQVFYRENDERSKNTAQVLQKLINDSLQPNHTKQIKPIDSSLYLFANTTNPAILIECGFLTNRLDLDQLKDPDYQSKLAALIYKATKEEDDSNG